MTVSEVGPCQYCGARLLWVDTQNAKRIALDHEPERRYVLDSGSNPMVAKQRNVYTCHFDTCPKKKEQTT